jgi:hypothetical protein
MCVEALLIIYKSPCRLLPPEALFGEFLTEALVQLAQPHQDRNFPLEQISFAIGADRDQTAQRAPCHY